MVYNWLKKLQSHGFPTQCRLCRAPGLPGLEVCADCHPELPWLGHGCRTCAAPLPADTRASLCPSCQSTQPQLDSCQALFRYHAPVDRWIQALKFHQDLTSARLLGQLLAAKLPPCPADTPIAVLPVPLHRKRLAQRGYNQAFEIARPLRRKGYRLLPRHCERHKDTQAQSELPARKRAANLRAAFSVARPLKGEDIIIIDDVLTTGATLNELARTLKHAGAGRVEAWVIARTVKP